MLMRQPTLCTSRWTATLPAVLLVISCTGCETGPAPLTAEHPLHLEEHLDTATVISSEVPADVPAAVEWRFDEPQPDWKPLVPRETSIKPIEMARTEDALRLTLTKANRLENF